MPEKTSKGPGESKRLSSSKVRAESPTGDHKVVLRDGNVILVDLKKSNTETQLTPDGAEGKDGWVGPINWSPDGRHFALWRERTVAVRQYLVTDSVKQTQKPMSYDKPGDDRTEPSACFPSSSSAASPDMASSNMTSIAGAGGDFSPRKTLNSSTPTRRATVTT